MAGSSGGSFEDRAQRDALSRGLTSDEYGVYKGSAGSAVKPVNSARGLLILAIVVTALNVAMLVLIGTSIAQELGYLARPDDYTEFSPVLGLFFLGALAFVPVTWRLYAKERRAQKLRIARGLPKNLPPERA